MYTYDVFVKWSKSDHFLRQGVVSNLSIDNFHVFTRTRRKPDFEDKMQDWTWVWAAPRMAILRITKSLNCKPRKWVKSRHASNVLQCCTILYLEGASVSILFPC